MNLSIGLRTIAKKISILLSKENESEANTVFETVSMLINNSANALLLLIMISEENKQWILNKIFGLDLKEKDLSFILKNNTELLSTMSLEKLIKNCNNITGESKEILRSTIIKIIQSNKHENKHFFNMWCYGETKAFVGGCTIDQIIELEGSYKLYLSSKKEVFSIVKYEKESTNPNGDQILEFIRKEALKKGIEVNCQSDNVCILTKPKIEETKTSSESEQVLESSKNSYTYRKAGFTEYEGIFKNTNILSKKQYRELLKYLQSNRAKALQKFSLSKLVYDLPKELQHQDEALPKEINDLLFKVITKSKTEITTKDRNSLIFTLLGNPNTDPKAVEYFKKVSRFVHYQIYNLVRSK